MTTKDVIMGYGRVSAGIVAGAFLVAGCAHGGAQPLPPTTTSSAVPTTIASVTACATKQLSVTSSSNSGMGHIGVVLVFTNVSRTPCIEQGFPGVAALTSSGSQAVQARRTFAGYLGGAKTLQAISLSTGQSASAVVEGTDVPWGTATTCPTYPQLLVTPPNATESVTISASLPGCSPIEVHPVIPGRTGLPPATP